MEHHSGGLHVETLVEIISGRLYFAVVKGSAAYKMKSTNDTFYFNIDNELFYNNYYLDFGPLNISCLYKYCLKLNKYLSLVKGLRRVVHYTTNNDKKKANAAFLMGSYAVIYLQMYPEIVAKMLQPAGPFKGFVDASPSPSPYKLSIINCLRAIYKALAFKFFDFKDFNDIEYDRMNSIQYGDLNWLVPKKFIAFIGPNQKEILNLHKPDFYIKYFLKNDVKTVIRLNKKSYDAAVFREAGINHYDLIFADGSVPPTDILLKFLEIAEEAPSVIAVHCKAGLGRTGSLIGAYLLKHYRMTAKEAIAWMRICRPGSVIGHQQYWLEYLEKPMWDFGAQYRIPCHKYGIYSRKWPVVREKMIQEARRKQSKSLCDEPMLKRTERRLKSASPTNKPYLKVSTLTKGRDSKYNLEKPLCSTKSAIFERKLSAKKNTQGDKLNNIKTKRHNSMEEKTLKQKISILYQKHNW
ncbi:dual specificity protein phosphatase CDC14A isoform X2 [Aethina tumida]|uniref:dual specificity protein phosphatase CDC14A isoform X2 n=1 Tax=Aethina tumida TaxID=116153 RepID=UPI0021486A04|nr:dual specificity protein phosphatase CDC14A isoform X2 [Aethina tumida]